MSSKKLSQRQARWAEYLSRFDFLLRYRPGHKDEKPDALTRRSGDLPKEKDEILKMQNQVLLKPENLDDRVKAEIESKIEVHLAQADLHLTPVQTRRQTRTQESDLVSQPEVTREEPSSEVMRSRVIPENRHVVMKEDEIAEPSIEELFTEGNEADPIPQEVLTALRTGFRIFKYLSLAECKEHEGKLYYRNRRYVSDHASLHLRLVQMHHDKLIAGHSGSGNTYKLLCRNYYWSRMQRYVRRYVKNCIVCRTCKTFRNAKTGYLASLDVSQHRWQDITVDFVTGLPKVEEKDAVCVVVDRLTKERHIIVINYRIEAREFARFFVDHVYRLHGLPRSITSDRETQFVNEFWRYVCEALEIMHALSTAYHSETDDQTERFNAVFEQYLRAYVSYNQDD